METAAPEPTMEAAAPAPASDKVDLSAMTFEERLEYLAAQAPTSPVAEEEDDDLGSILPLKMSDPETLWWRKEFWSLCVQDLKEMQWMNKKELASTVVTSQIAFVCILAATKVFDTVVETGVRALLGGK